MRINIFFAFVLLLSAASTIASSADSPKIVRHAQTGSVHRLHNPAGLRVVVSRNGEERNGLPPPSVIKSPDEIFPVLQSPEKYRSIIMLRARDEYEKEAGVRFNKIIRGNKTKKMIALTFDDGPHAVYTLKLLDILQATHTPATFFLVGKQVDKFPTLVQLELIEGHELGNHTYDHVELTQIPPQLIGFELDECDRAIKRATGALPRFFRPPGGDYDNNVVQEASRRKYIVALWTDDPGDYAKPGADVVLQRCLDRLENGAVILLHDGIPETISILPALITEARKRGYEFVTMSELAKDR